jgi:hypothetical protein
VTVFLVTIYDEPDRCRQCLGWKRVANSDDGESWKYWAELAPPSNLAVMLGVVQPVECPRCKGTGKEPSDGNG